MTRHQISPLAMALARAIPLRTTALLMLAGVMPMAYAQTEDGQGKADKEVVELKNVQVSARKRSERLQDVPVAITALTSDDLERMNVRNIEDTVGRTPSLSITGNGLSPGRDFRQLVIRGVGANSQLEPSVATFVDGVYAPGLAFDSELLDVERIEVLKGPQGALFGRNTEGGAVNVVLKRPDDTPTGRVKFGVESFNTQIFSAAVSGPLIPGRLFGSASVLTRQSDYFVEQRGVAANPYNAYYPGQDLVNQYNAGDTEFKSADGQREVSSRGSLRYVVDDGLEINLSGHYSQFKGVDQAPGPLESCGCYVVDGDLAYQNTSESYGVALNVEKRFDGMTFNAIAGYEKATSSVPYDFDGTRELVNNYHDFDRDQSSSSLELRLASDSDAPLQWLGGLYAFHDEQYNNRFYTFSNMDFPGGPQSSYDGLWNQQLTELDRKGYAAFGQVSYSFSPKWELSVGGRYSWDKVDVSALERFEFMPNGVITSYLSSLAYGWADFYTPVTNDASWSNFSPQMSLRYKWTPDIMTYVTVSRGFKTGSFQVAPVYTTDVYAVNPEKTTNYEIGLKGQFFDRMLGVDLTAYHIDIDDQQLQSARVVGNITTSAITNASSSEVDGAELDVTWRPSAFFSLSANAAYTDARFTDYQIYTGGRLVDLSGDAFPNTPKLAYQVAAQYIVPFSRGDLIFDASYRYFDDIHVGTGTGSSDAIHPVPDWNRTDVSATWQTGHWAIKGYVQNLTDEYIILSSWRSFQVQPTNNYWHSRVAAPRTYGLSVAYSF